MAPLESSTHVAGWQFRKEFDRQVDLGFLAKVNEPMDWVNSLVIAEKSNGKMRLCIDPKDLNKEIKREHFQIPTKEEIIGKLQMQHSSRNWTRLPAFIKYHWSSLLTTFNTPFGRYRYMRPQMGICSAPDIFHKTVHQFLEDIESVSVYMDDVVFWGSTTAEHGERLNETLQRLSEVGLGLNMEKCVFRQPELSYLGEVVTKHGVKRDLEKIQASTDMPTPTNATEL